MLSRRSHEGAATGRVQRWSVRQGIDHGLRALPRMRVASPLLSCLCHSGRAGRITGPTVGRGPHAEADGFRFRVRVQTGRFVHGSLTVSYPPQPSLKKQNVDRDGYRILRSETRMRIYFFKKRLKETAPLKNRTGRQRDRYYEKSGREEESWEQAKVGLEIGRLNTSQV